MPISVAGGFLIDQLYQLWRSIIPSRLHILFLLCVLAVSFLSAIYGAQQLIPILNPATILTHESDLKVIAWIDQNIPNDELILINPFAWGYGIFAGADGGGWIPALAGNPTIPPPVLYGLGEREQIEYINQISRDVINLGDSPEELWKYLSSLQIKYIYIGSRGGIISPGSLASNSHFRVIHCSDNTWVYQLLP